jgi:[NiFe] hydrogenase diaphorase moiety large subunit
MTPQGKAVDSKTIQTVVRAAMRRCGATNRDDLLAVLTYVQRHIGHLPDRAIANVASALHLPYGEVAGVVSFYAFFHSQPMGLYDCRLADNIIERHAGNGLVQERLGTLLKGDLGTLNTTSCIGLSDQAPGALINGAPIPALQGERLEQVAHLMEKEIPLARWPAALCRVKPNIRHADRILQQQAWQGEALRAAMNRGAEELLAELEGSGLRGMGGAGFPTARKWRSVREVPTTDRVVVCNADEGEPGTFKDRALLQRHADALFEGMTIAGWCVGAQHGFVYLRGEYRYMLPMLQRRLAARRRAGLLGQDILGVPGFHFDIQVRLGAGAYVCGEESALLESLEGKRGIPRPRPPYPVEAGFHGAPTVVNNVETLSAACLVAVHGGAWYASLGTTASKGTKLFSVSGDCSRPGVYELPMGTTLQQLLQLAGARHTMAVQMGGASGALVAPGDFGEPIAFEALPPGGSVMIFDESRSVSGIVHNFAAFFAHESCGFCTPCRVGTRLQRDLVHKFTVGHGGAADIAELKELGLLMGRASHCGLGQSAGRAVGDALQHFPGHFPLSPQSAFVDLDAALEQARTLRQSGG